MSHPTHLEGYAIPLRHQYVGGGWYRKVLLRRQEWAGKRVWLKIGGVNSEGRFWVNGRYLGFLNRSCGAYKFDLTPYLQDDKNIVVIFVSNQVLSRKGLLNWQDQFGGLYRSVELDVTSAAYIDDVWAQPDYQNRRAVFGVKISSAGAAQSGNYRLGINVSTLPEGQPAGQGQTDLQVSETVTEILLPVQLNPLRPWSPEDPALYRADLVLRYEDQDIDGWAERFGIRAIERSGTDILLNGKKTFLLGFGDDYVYPLTIASPPSRSEHLKHLKLARSYGFNYIRLHTHVEMPEYFEAAEEAGVMIQPELAYERSLPAIADGCYSPLDDLNELTHHYRRYVSLISYCMGNEGFHRPETQRVLYRFSKAQDPTRLVRAQDGEHTDYEGISDLHGGPIGDEPIKQEDIFQTMPVILHEYLNLSGPPDYRLASRFTGAEMQPYESVLDRPVDPNVPSQLLVHTQPKLLSGTDRNGRTDLGVSPALAERVIEAGHEFQSIYQKIGLERGRMMKGVVGYNYWTIVDVNGLMPQGLLNMFWEPKRSTPEYFRQFNSPLVLLLPDLSPYGKDRVLTSGSRRSLHLACSNFGPTELNRTRAFWTLEVEGKSLASGRLENIRVSQGTIADVGTIELNVPELSRPSELWLRVQLEGTKASNSWQFYGFPKTWPRASLKNAIASAALHSALSKYYPELHSGAPQGAGKQLVFADRLDRTVLQLAEAGSTVVLLSLSDFAPIQPGVRLGWWGPRNQRGTAFTDSSAFGDFPSKGGLPTFAIFNILSDAAPLQGKLINRVDPLMITLSQLGYAASVFETRVGRGRLFATGLDLLSGFPEGLYLFDQFVRYVQSARFTPQSSISPADLAEVIQRSSKSNRKAATA